MFVYLHALLHFGLRPGPGNSHVRLENADRQLQEERTVRNEVTELSIEIRVKDLEVRASHYRWPRWGVNEVIAKSKVWLELLHPDIGSFYGALY